MRKQQFAIATGGLALGRTGTLGGVSVSGTGRGTVSTTPKSWMEAKAGTWKMSAV